MINCAKSPDPNVEEIIKISSPTFSNGLTQGTFLSASKTLNLRGSCDKKATLTEYSYDNKNWTKLDCVGGRFQITLLLLPRVILYARSKGKFNYSPVSKAIVRFVPPETAPTLTLVTSSKSDNSDDRGRGTQNVISHNFSGEILTDNVMYVQTMLPRMVYEVEE
jgi:hypothetical protein